MSGYTLEEIQHITTEQYRPWAKDLRGAHVQLQDVLERKWKPYICGLCWEPVYLDPYAIKHKGSALRAPAWLHKVTQVRWCAPDKQHGRKTRKVFPLPGLYVIEEGFL